MIRSVVVSVSFSAIVLLAAIPAVQIPAGTEIQIRLTTAVSSATAKAKDPVTAVVIAPAGIPGGIVLTGTVKSAKPGVDKTQAELDLRFILAGTTAIDASVASLENARETVNANGVILGIVGSETYSSRIEQGIEKMSGNSKLAGLATILEGATQAMKIQPADPNIVYAVGTELTLKLNKPISWAAPDTSAFSKLKEIPNGDALIDLVNWQPFRTATERPTRPSDITNLMFIGTEAQLRNAFEKAGWTTAAKLSSQSKMETARAIIEARGYKEGPMSVLLLDGNAPDMVFQKGNNTFASRHHLRIFRRPDTFAGQPVWVCSSTHDTGIEYSDANRTFIHKIDSNIDRERAKVAGDLIFTGLVQGIALVDRPEIPQKISNATGDLLETDGKMAVLLLNP